MYPIEHREMGTSAAKMLIEAIRSGSAKDPTRRTSSGVHRETVHSTALGCVTRSR
jgi:hypothetical protein